MDKKEKELLKNISKDATLFKQAPLEMKKNRMFSLKSISMNPKTFNNMLEKFKQDEDFITEAIDVNISVIKEMNLDYLKKTIQSEENIQTIMEKCCTLSAIQENCNTEYLKEHCNKALLMSILETIEKI